MKAEHALSAPLQCKVASKMVGRTLTFAVRPPNEHIGARLAGGVYNGNELVQNFNVQVRANHVATYVDRTVLTQKLLARIFRPGSHDKSVLVTMASA